MSVYSNKDLKRNINKKDIVICPLAEASITPLGYDISIGEIITLSSKSGNKLVKANGKIEIPAKSLNIVIAKELIWLSGNVVGTLHSRGTLACKGIFTNSTNVDPNFGGQMVMSIYNTTDRIVLLDEDAPFITLIFHSTLTYTPDGPGWKKAARVLDELEKEYLDPIDIAEIHKLNAYMNANNTQHGSDFNDLMTECKKWGIIKATKSYIYDFRNNYGSSLSKSISGIVYILCLVFLIANLGQVMYYTFYGNDTKASSEKYNLYVILAALLAISNKK
jgi:deoxycytidine triphosphate deaminase